MNQQKTSDTLKLNMPNTPSTPKIPKAPKTRAYTVRLNSWVLAELISIFEKEKGWKVKTVGGFLREVIEQLYVEQTAERESLNFENTAQANSFLEMFGSGRTVVNQLSQANQDQTSFDQTSFDENQPEPNFVRKNPTKNSQKAEKQRQRRQVKKELGLQAEQTNTATEFEKAMSVELKEKFLNLNQPVHKSAVEAYFKMGFSWEQIEQAIEQLTEVESTQLEQNSEKEES